METNTIVSPDWRATLQNHTHHNGISLLMESLANLFHTNPETWKTGTGSGIAYKNAVFFWILFLSYIPMIFVLKRYMRDRNPYTMKRQTFVWNLVLSVCSIYGFFLGLFSQPDIFLEKLVEESDYSHNIRKIITIFTLTKFLEFGDTFILVLKKRPLTFLHVYHHLTVAMYCWHAQLVNINFGHYFAFMNLFVHGIMYMYYALSVHFGRSLIMRKFRPIITCLQLLQMFIGLYFAFIGVTQCTQADMQWNANLSYWMYASYAVLFAHFFIQNFLQAYNATRLLVSTIVGITALKGLYYATILLNEMYYTADKGFNYTLISALIGLMSISLYSVHMNQKHTSMASNMMALTCNGFLSALLYSYNQKWSTLDHTSSTKDIYCEQKKTNVEASVTTQSHTSQGSTPVQSPKNQSTCGTRFNAMDEKNQNACIKILQSFVRDHNPYFKSYVEPMHLGLGLVLCGALFYENIWVGICVYGPLRWCIEAIVYATYIM